MLSGEEMIKKNSLPLFFDKTKHSRLGLMPKCASSADQIMWFELPPFMIFHTAGAALRMYRNSKLYNSYFFYCCTLQGSPNVQHACLK